MVKTSAVRSRIVSGNSMPISQYCVCRDKQQMVERERERERERGRKCVVLGRGRLDPMGGGDYRYGATERTTPLFFLLLLIPSACHGVPRKAKREHARKQTYTQDSRG